MGRCDYERLSALDASFLYVEDSNAHMHVGAVGLFDAAPLRQSDGTIAIDRVRRLVADSFRKFPRYRQRVTSVPLFNRAVWVDDHRFSITYHVRHTALPKPGDERALKRMAARIMSQPLDRGKPLWEMWVIEGLEGDRVALLSKVHHCMIDGVSGAELIGSLLRPTSEHDQTLDEPAPPWIPRPVPRARDLVLHEAQRMALEPLRMAASAVRAAASPRKAVQSAGQVLSGVREVVGAGLRGASETPINRAIGPHRRFDWTALSFDEIKEVKDRLDGHVNDVVLTVAAGAIGRFLRARGLRLENLDFRALVPVSVRTNGEQDALGNRVTSMLAPLPIAERDPRQRFEQIKAIMTKLKASPQAVGVRVIEELADVTSNTLLTGLAKLSALTRTYNIVITNVPGPQVPLYMLGSRLSAIYPLVPLFENQALGIAVFSYDGDLYWGFNADHDGVPDLHELVRNIETEFGALKEIAMIGGARFAATG